ncbi:MAG: hypothetical protein CMJ75_04455 [Planctomycetaceae bacterium]|nr:hypothetical protein [Planctomycetaceae bacterium]
MDDQPSTDGSPQLRLDENITMDDITPHDITPHDITMDDAVQESGPVDTESQPFVGRWHRLVSTTNWEKGRIIHEWRQTLIASDQPTREYSDEAWAQRVGGVTGQHTGRLRRVFDRFGEVYESYQGLCWSHFQAALDWNDAEMWLEGAVQDQWSVNRMRNVRWETLGQPDSQRPQPADVIANELDEDFSAEPSSPRADTATTGSVTPTYADVQASPATKAHDPDEAEADVIAFPAPEGEPGSTIYSDADERSTIEFVRPFENIKDLPENLAEAFEAFKLAILQHKATDWQEISREDVLASLDALKELASSPTPDEAPF